MAKVVLVIGMRNISRAYEFSHMGPGFYVLFEKVVEPVGGAMMWGLAPSLVGFL